MKTFFRCQCWKRAGLKRTQRAPGCDDKRAFQFRDGNVLPPVMTPYRDPVEALRFAVKYRENYFRTKHGQPLADDETAQCFRKESSGAKTARLADAVVRFNDWTTQNRAEKTASNYARTMTHFEAVIGADTMVHTIEPDDIERFKTARLKTIVVVGKAATRRDAGIEPKLTKKKLVTKQTVRTDLIVVQSFFRQCSVWYGIRSPFTPIALDGRMRSPIDRFRSIPDRIVPVQPLSLEDVDRLVEELPDPYGDICRITFEALCRIGAVMTIERGDFGIGRAPDGSKFGWLRQRLKGGKTKDVGIPLALAELLLRREQQMPAHETRLFWMVTPSSASSNFRRHLDALGFAKVTHHWLRHTGVTTMKSRRDVNDADIKTLAGWTPKSKQLDHYNHTQQHGVIRAAEGNAALLLAARKKRARKRLRVVAGGAA